MTYDGETDEALIGRYAGGDSSAFEMLYRRHEMRAWRYLDRNLSDQAAADGLLQEVWFLIARDAEQYDPGTRFRTWLFSLIHTRMIDSVQESQRQAATEQAADTSTAAAGHEPLIALNDAIRQLSREQREAFLLQMEGQLSIDEVARVTDSTFETTKTRLRNARAHLRELLDQPA
jgi:RNA polymerase sigma factor (sigma-70 family)